MRNYLKYLTLIIIPFWLFSCKSSQKSVTPRNLNDIYSPGSVSVHPDIKIYNISDTASIFINRIYLKELLYNQANTESKLLARVKVSFNLYDLSDKLELVDSLTSIYKFEKDTEGPYFNIEVPVKTFLGANYLLEVITTDINRKSTHYSFKRIDRTNNSNLQDFLVYDNTYQNLKINSWIKQGEHFRIKHYKRKIDSMTVFFFSNNFKIAQRPFMNDTVVEALENADTSWMCYLDSIQYENFNKEGIYIFSINTDLKGNEGFPLFNFGDVFPILKTPDDLIKPLVYLGFNDSVPENDSTSKYTKLAVDNFWLSKANNVDKSRELLKLYYTRVTFANIYFTSYKEGWQTDRGMIYIIYGKPDYLFKSDTEERWIYNPEGIGTGISFIFKYIKNPYSLNHYELDREKLKATGWDEMIKLWNNGEIFYFQN